jgi:hypothetical protein
LTQFHIFSHKAVLAEEPLRSDLIVPLSLAQFPTKERLELALDLRHISYRKCHLSRLADRILGTLASLGPLQLSGLLMLQVRLLDFCYNKELVLVQTSFFFDYSVFFSIESMALPKTMPNIPKTST